MKKILIVLLVPFLLNQADSQVTQEWASVFSGPGNFNDQAAAIVTDGLGNVIVTGRTVGSSPTSNFCTVKYNTSGVQQWAAIYNGPSDDYDQAFDLVADDSGNIYVTGMILNTITGYDIALVKYNSAGTQQWVKSWSNPGNSDDVPNKMTRDIYGNIYITGETVPAFGHYITLKYSTGGSLLWAKTLGQGIALYIETDAAGNIYVTGQDESLMTGSDFLTVKYNQDGDSLWVRRYGTSDYNERPKGLAVDINGNCYITGSVTPGSTAGFLTVKYNSAGTFQWASHNDSCQTSEDLEVDALGNVYVTGSTFVGGSANIATIKFNSSGIRQWIAIYDYVPEERGDYSFDLELDAAGNVYIAGSSQNSGGTQRDALTLKYNNSGIQQWVARYELAYTAEALDLTLDNNNNVFITGYRETGGNADFLTIKYSQTVGIHQISNEVPGQFLLEQNYPNPFNPVTKLGFRISDLGFVSLKIYDIQGREAATLVNEQLQPGTYEVDFNGSKFTSGVYFYRLEADGFIETKRMILTK